MSKDAMKKYESGICAYCGKKKEEHNIEGIFIWCDESPEDIPTFADSGIAGVERNAFELLKKSITNESRRELLQEYESIKKV